MNSSTLTSNAGAQSVKFAKCQYQFPAQGALGLRPLRESNDILHDVPALHARMAEDGYLLIRGLIDRHKVFKARETILGYMAEHEGLEAGSRPLDGVMGTTGKSVGMLGRRGITHHPDVQAVLEGPELFGFYSRYFNESVTTFDYKWLRAVGKEEFTGAHYDVVYMGRGSPRLTTCWVPFADISIEQGVLAMCVGSNHLPGFQKLRDTYGKMDVDRDHIDGWFSTDPLEITEKFGGYWATSHFQAGDIITFGMYTMHASTTNTTDRWRLSCDVRFQPVSDPMDHRWAGNNAVGHAVSPAPVRIKSIAEVREQWGV